MSAKKKVLTFGKVLTYVLLLLLVVGMIGFFALFTNGFTSDLKSFYVEFNGKKILTQNNNLALDCDKELRFDIKYTFDVFAGKDSEPKGYSVQIVPNITAETNFDFTVDGQIYSFAGEKDLTSAFNIVEYDTYFTLNLPSTLTLQQVLQAVYGNAKTVTVDNAKSNLKYYRLVITSYDGTVSYSIFFNPYYAVISVTLDKEEIIV